jgi:hypothetical protein
MSFPPGDLNGHPAPALGLDYAVTLTLGAVTAEPPPAAGRGADLFGCYPPGPPVDVPGQERMILARVAPVANCNHNGNQEKPAIRDLTVEDLFRTGAPPGT